jgi:hypothetical protein
MAFQGRRLGVAPGTASFRAKRELSSRRHEGGRARRGRARKLCVNEQARHGAARGQRGFEKEDLRTEFAVGFHCAGQADDPALDQPLDRVYERLAQGLVQRLPLIDYGTRPAVLEQGPLRLREAALEHTDDQVLADVGARLSGPLSDVLLVQAHD